MICVTLGTHKYANGNQSLEQHDNTMVTSYGESVGGPYCGLYSIYAIARHLNHTVNYVDLQTVEYVSDVRGSSINELINAIQEVTSMDARAVSNLSTRALSDIALPAILHVKRGVYMPDFDHYVAFLGTTPTGYLIHDAPDLVKIVSARELESIWNGVAIFVSDQPITTMSLVRERWLKSHVRFAAIAFAAIAICSTAISRFNQARSAKWLERLSDHSQLVRYRLFSTQVVVQAVGIVSAAFLSASVDQGLKDPHDRLVTRYTYQWANTYAHAQQVQYVSVESLVKLIASSKTIIYDARSLDVYREGHILNARHMPVTVSNQAFRRELQRIPSENMQIVTYCESNDCDYSVRLARRFIEAGFKDVLVFEGGWRAWLIFQNDGQSIQ